MSHYKLLVLLRLRDKHVREAKTLYDFFFYDDPEEEKLIVKEIIASNGEEMLLLFEGYDELPAQMQRDENSILLQIISGKCLPKATILITSQHSASGFLHNEYEKRISQHIEILGFTKENIQTYINENVKDREERQGLESYLSCYPHIRTMMYIPLNSVIVVEVYHQCHDKDKPVPKTVTELYTSLIRTLLIRYLSVNPSYKHCTKIIEFTDLQDKVYEQFQQICKTAYRGVANGQELIFYDLADNFETLGLMQEVHELYVDKGDFVSYNFLHLTMQEYLAAVHLSMQQMDKQIQHFKEKKTTSSFEMVLRFLSGLTKFHNYPQQDLTLIFEPWSYQYRLAGLNFHWLLEAQNVEYISSVLKEEVISVDELSTPFEAYALGYCVANSNLRWKLSHIARDSTTVEMLIRGFQAGETQCKGTLIEVFVEINKDTLQLFKPTLLIKFFRGITCRITTLSYFTGVATELVKDLASCFTSLEVAVKDNEIKMEQSKILGELMRSSTSLRHFTMDIIHVPQNNSQSAEWAVDTCSCLQPIVTALGQNTYLDRVSFPNGLFRLRALAALMRTGRSELYPRVLQLLGGRFDDKDEALFLGKCYIYHPNATTKHLSPAKICSLYIDDIPFRYVGDTSFLSDFCTLSKLVIKNVDLSGNNTKCITEGFLVHFKGADNKSNDEVERSPVDVEGRIKERNKTCPLEHIGLENCKVGHIIVQHLAQALRVNTSVKTLNLSDNPVYDEGAKALAEMLGGNGGGAVSTALEHVDLSCCSIGPIGAQHLAQDLCVNTSVKTLLLKDNPLGDKVAKTFAEMLGGNGADSNATVNTTLEHVDLSSCSMGSAGAQHLAHALCVNTSVKTLKLSENFLHDKGAKALAEMLGGQSSGTVNTTLEHIDLRYCSIGPVGAQYLAQALCVNISVKTLRLSENFLHDEGAKAIAEMLGGNTAGSNGTVNTTLEYVDLSHCYIESVGGQLLAQALCVNPSLNTLVFLEQQDLTLRDVEENLTEQQKERIARRYK